MKKFLIIGTGLLFAVQARAQTPRPGWDQAPPYSPQVNRSLDYWWHIKAGRCVFASTPENFQRKYKTQYSVEVVFKKVSETEYHLTPIPRAGEQQMSPQVLIQGKVRCDARAMEQREPPANNDKGITDRT